MSGSAIALPASIDGITAEWLTLALRQGKPGIEVRRASVLSSLGGACTKLRVAIETNEPDFPATVIVKGCFEPHTRSMVPLQLREAMIYERVVPFLDNVETVRCHFVQADELLGSALIMEDLELRGITCRNARDPIVSYALAEDYLGNLARLHARWWNRPDIASRLGFPTCLDQLAIPRSERAMADPEIFAQEIRKPRAACLSRTILDGPRLLRAFKNLKARSRAMPMTLTHGDMHPSNLFTTPDNRGGLLDWTSMHLPWAQDVSYFIGGNLDPVDRREWEKPLLRYYIAALSALGIRAPKFEEAWLTYRGWMLWGIYVWLFNIPEHHTEENITAMTARFGTALVDHGTLALLDA